MAFVHAVIALALIQFMVYGILVGRARIQYEIPAPAITGHEIFERYYRVHYNTMEQLVQFIPAILLFAYYVNAPTAAVLGLVFIVGRVVYFRAYIADPAKRGPGFGLTVLPTTIMLLGGLGGAIWAAFSSS
ncbi:MAG: MAPEG family protein [Chromatiales bacterium]|nr:MAG: MAPEG family protein [Chromatiales bacterium]